MENWCRKDHEQLVEVEGKYREMWQSQIQDFVEEGD